MAWEVVRNLKIIYVARGSDCIVSFRVVLLVEMIKIAREGSALNVI